MFSCLNLHVLFCLFSDPQLQNKENSNVDNIGEEVYADAP